MKEEGEGQGRPQAKALEVVSGPVFSPERFTHSQAFCSASGPPCPGELPSQDLCPAGGEAGPRISVAGYFTSIPETYRVKGRSRKKGFNSLIDLREVEEL